MERADLAVSALERALDLHRQQPAPNDSGEVADTRRFGRFEP